MENLLYNNPTEDLWYNNPKILIENFLDFVPNKNLNKNQKINSMVRFAIYYAVLLILFNQDTKWLSISVIIILLSLFLAKSEEFASIKSSSEFCTIPTKENPFMNFNINNPTDKPACKYDDIKENIRKEFRTNIPNDPNDIWGKFISDRNFYIMPNTEIVNKQTEFAEWCFGTSGKCKTEGRNC